MRPMGLTNKYKYLQKMQQMGGGGDVVCGNELDNLYRQISEGQIKSIVDALEKLYFSYHCIMIEEDFKEAARLIKQVYRAFEKVAAGGPLDDLLSGAMPRASRRDKINA